MGDTKKAILYGYSASPFNNKATALLAHYRVPYDIVKMPSMPPRPMLSEELGVTYRKVPLLALDGQLYCDTNAIAQVLHDTFADKPGHGESLLKKDAVLQRQLSLLWFDQLLFGIAATLLDVSQLPKSFVQDRRSIGATYIGSTPRENAVARLREQLIQVEQHLRANEASGAGTYFFGTKEPQFVDFSAYVPLNWIQMLQKSAPDLLPTEATSSSPFPLTVKYLSAVRAHIQKAQSSIPKPAVLDAKEAAKSVVESSKATLSDLKAAGIWFDGEDPFVKAGKLQVNDEVDVTPTDTGRVPQRGKLIGLSTERVSLKVQAGAGVGNAPIVVTFPRSNFKVKRSQDAKM